MPSGSARNLSSISVGDNDSIGEEDSHGQVLDGIQRDGVDVVAAELTVERRVAA